MRGLLLFGLAFVLSTAIVSGARAGAGSAPRGAGDVAPVASLEPSRTNQLWQRLVASPQPSPVRAQADCRPLRGVFYAATDFLRLATKLAATPSPCAEYYISIPPLVSDKTLPRPNAASRIRALGPNFHAMAEIHFATWTRWVASTGSSWHTAGVTARARMAAADYDVAKGDTWVFNELTTAVRRGTGNARANVREFLRGLYEGDGTRPTRGAVFVIGFGQRSGDVSLYQTNLQNWLADAAFWTDMTTYVSDWTQEVYGDVRSYAVPGAPPAVRRDYLNDYLQHKLVLAGIGPPEIETSRSYLRSAYSPLANAAWERDSGYGWTMVSTELMAAYVSAQVHALRFHSATTGQARDHWGFAWAPKNARGIPGADFAAQTGLILDRLAVAVRDSGRTPDPTDPGSAACGPPGQNLYCVGDLEGAVLAETWKSFRGWTQPVLAFGTPAQTITAGAASAPMRVNLGTSSGLPTSTPTPVAVALSSTSEQGGFSTSPAGPWSRTLSVTIAAGTGLSADFYYRDTRAGTHALTASAFGVTSATQPVTVAPGPAAALTITPASVSIPARASQRFAVAGADAHGNAVPVMGVWSLAPRDLGTLAPRAGNVTTFAARRMLGNGTVLVSVATSAGPISAGAGVRVTPGRLRIGSIRYRSRKGVVLVTATAIDVNGSPISRAVISVAVRRNGRTHFSARAVTGAAGRTAYRVPVSGGGCLTTLVKRVSAPGFAWDGRAPRNRYCRPN